MSLIRKCGVLILHKRIKSKRSGNYHDYWIAYSKGAFNLNWCNGHKMATHSTHPTLKAAFKHFGEFIL